MWMCETCIVVNRRNPDGNSLADIVAALNDLGASIGEIDEEHHVIYAVLPASELETISRMDGISHVRTVCRYLASPQAEPKV